jgi:lysozyme
VAGEAPRLSPKALSAAVTGVLLLAATLTRPWEGRRHHPYMDIGGVKTVCDGHTGQVEDRRYSDDECDALLMGDLAEAYGYVVKCIHVPLERHQAAALTDAVYNIGPAVVCGSTLQTLANRGDMVGACNQLMRWNRAGGREVLGLTRRRAAERAMCLGEP